MNPIAGAAGVLLILIAFLISVFTIPGSFGYGSPDPNAPGVFSLVTPLQVLQIMLGIMGLGSITTSLVSLKGPRKG